MHMDNVGGEALNDVKDFYLRRACILQRLQPWEDHHYPRLQRSRHRTFKIKSNTRCVCVPFLYISHGSEP